jgi:hypothetical protein
MRALERAVIAHNRGGASWWRHCSILLSVAMVASFADHIGLKLMCQCSAAHGANAGILLQMPRILRGRSPCQPAHPAAARVVTLRCADLMGVERERQIDGTEAGSTRDEADGEA